MRIQNVSRAQFEDVLQLERELFGDEALNRYELFPHLRKHSESCFVAVFAGAVHGYALGEVNSRGVAWITALACRPQLTRGRHIAFDLAQAMATSLRLLNASIGFATTRRPSIRELAKRFNGRVVGREDFYGDGRLRDILEFRP